MVKCLSFTIWYVLFGMKYGLMSFVNHCILLLFTHFHLVWFNCCINVIVVPFKKTKKNQPVKCWLDRRSPVWQSSKYLKSQRISSLLNEFKLAMCNHTLLNTRWFLYKRHKKPFIRSWLVTVSCGKTSFLKAIHKFQMATLYFKKASQN